MNIRSYTLNELAAMVNGIVSGDGNTPITGVAGIQDAEHGEITFVANPKYAQYLGTTRASAVIALPDLGCPLPAIRLDNPYLAYLKVLSLFAPAHVDKYAREVHPSAVIDSTVRLGNNLSIAPFCRIDKRSRLGDGCTVLHGSYIGEDVTIGANCLIYPSVTILDKTEIGDNVIIHPGAVIGSDGFGYAQDGAVRHKIPHIGRVIIEDDVEIGANTTIDRATTGATHIRRGTKIDNLVQIAHNVVVGDNCAIAGQVGISGSTELGARVVLGGQVGLVGHIKVGDGVVAGAKAGVTKSFPANTTVSGFPAREHSHMLRTWALNMRLPDLFKRIQELEEKVRKLEQESGHDQATTDHR